MTTFEVVLKRTVIQGNPARFNEIQFDLILRPGKSDQWAEYAVIEIVDHQVLNNYPFSY